MYEAFARCREVSSTASHISMQKRIVLTHCLSRDKRSIAVLYGKQATPTMPTELLFEHRGGRRDSSPETRPILCTLS